MIDLLRQRDTSIPLSPACEALGVPRSTAYRHMRPAAERAPRQCSDEVVRPSHRRLSDQERAQIVETMHSERFIDQTPRQAYAELLDEGHYIASMRTFYRILAAFGESRERRNQRSPKAYAVPRLVAERPNEVWSWDISKLPTLVKGVFLNLYLVLDLFSRYPVAWMVAARENSALAKQLIAEAFVRWGIEPGTITLHNDRGAPMTALGFIDLLAELGVSRSISRPRVSNDNPFSESCFKTVKGQPTYPGRFRGVDDARLWCSEFFDWYANCHRHSGLAFFTPADVFFGRVEELATIRQQALDAAFALHPERFVRGRPLVKLPPARVCINPLDPADAVQEEKSLSRSPLSQPTAATGVTRMAPAEATEGVESDGPGAELG